MHVDHWAAASFKAMSPVILTHGNNSDAGFWDRHNFANALAAAHIPVDGCANTAICRNPLNLQTSFVAVNGARLASLIPDTVRTSAPIPITSSPTARAASTRGSSWRTTRRRT